MPKLSETQPKSASLGGKYRALEKRLRDALIREFPEIEVFQPTRYTQPTLEQPGEWSGREEYIPLTWLRPEFAVEDGGLSLYIGFIGYGPRSLQGQNLSARSLYPLRRENLRSWAKDLQEEVWRMQKKIDRTVTRILPEYKPFMADEGPVSFRDGFGVWMVYALHDPEGKLSSLRASWGPTIDRQRKLAGK